MTTPLPTADQLRTLMKTGRFSQGHLFRPGETTGNDAGAPFTQWTLCTAVPAAALQLFRAKRNECGIAVEGLHFANEFFWVISYQADTTQHRLLLPLVGKTVLAFLRAVKTDRAAVYLEAACESGALLASIEVPRDLQAAMLSSHRPEFGARAVLSASLAAACKLLEPDALPAIDRMQPPAAVTVAVILTPECYECVPGVDGA